MEKPHKLLKVRDTHDYGKLSVVTNTTI